MNNDIIIYTSSYKYFKEDNELAIAISAKPEVYANWHGKSYHLLAPKLSFWQTWHDMLGKVSELESTRYYIEEYYLQILIDLNPTEVLANLGNGIVLLCFEENTEFCHRHLAAFWLELTLGIKTVEVKTQKNKIVEVTRPEYLRAVLKEIMQTQRNIKSNKTGGLS